MNNKIWISYVDSRNTEDLRDLDHLFSLVWGANPNAKKGDIILMYRTAPFSDIKYMFTATSDSRRTIKSDCSDTEYVINLGEKIVLTDPVQLKEIKKNKNLKQWSFARNQQGMLKRQHDIKSEDYWEALSELILEKNSSLEYNNYFRVMPRWAKGIRKTPQRIKIFISYASENYPRVISLCRRLKGEAGFDYWIDKEKLLPGQIWDKKIREAITESHAVIICISNISIRKNGYLNHEIAVALKLAKSGKGGVPSIFTVKLEQCEINKSLSHSQHTDLFRKGGFNKLINGLNDFENVMNSQKLL